MKNCTDASTSVRVMSIVCKCHFPLRWCKTLLHGTSFFSLSLVHSLEQHYLKPSARPNASALSSLEMGAHGSPASILPSVSILQHPICQEWGLVAEWWDTRAFFNLSLDWTRSQTLNGEPFHKNLSQEMFLLFLLLGNFRVKWGLYFFEVTAMTQRSGCV